MSWYSWQESHLQPPRSKVLAHGHGRADNCATGAKGTKEDCEEQTFACVVRTTPEHLKDFSIRFLPSKFEMGPTEALACGHLHSRGAIAPGSLRNCRRVQTPVAAEPDRRNGGSPRCCPVLCGLRDRCIAAMLATRRRRDAKAELNHRNQACEVLADTGIRVAKRFPSAPNPAPGHYFGRARPRSARRVHLGKWTSIRVARPVFRFGRPACISQHLCS